jgi:cytidylate kinase
MDPHSSPNGKCCCVTFAITISRNIGSLGGAVVRDLAVHLGWQVFDKEIVEQIAQHSHVRQSLVEQLDERSQNLIHETVQRLLTMAAGASFGAEEYHEALLKTFAYMAARGEAILVGRGANFALREETHGLHVRIIASPEVRVRRLMERWGIPSLEARQRIEQTDMERRSFVRHHFKQDIDDLRNYDVVFNSDNLTARQISDSILGMIGALPADYAIAEDSMKTTKTHKPQGMSLEVR